MNILNMRARLATLRQESRAAQLAAMLGELDRVMGSLDRLLEEVEAGLVSTPGSAPAPAPELSTDIAPAPDGLIRGERWTRWRHPGLPAPGEAGFER